MNVLCDSGVVDWRKEDKWTYYSISEEGSRYAMELLGKLTEVKHRAKDFCDTEKC